MQESIARLVHPVLGYGLRLKEQLDRGEQPTFDIEQAALKGLLLSDVEARRWPDFGGDAPAGEGRGRTGQGFLGIRYALACWLDELFIAGTPWSARWNERKLEVALYGSNDRAWKFWEQARMAEARASRDAVEVFFLCVMLGFRGEMAEDPGRLQAWAAAARAQMLRGKGEEWTPPPDLEAATPVPPLEGRDRLRRMLTVGGVVLLVVLPLLAMLLIRNE